MKRIGRGWLPVLILLTLCLACSKPSEPSETQLAIQQFYDHLAAEEYTAVLGMYSAEVRQALEISGGQVDEAYIEWAQEETKLGKLDRIEIVEENVETDTATVKYRVYYGDGSQADRSVALKREGGQWKLGFIDNV